METFFRDLLHEQVSRKISVKAPKNKDEFFIAVLSPERHPSRCESKDFFWMKASGKHTLRQLKEIYSNKLHLHVVFSDGDRVLNDSTRLRKLNHFGDELIVIWAQRFDPSLPPVPAYQVRSPLQGSVTHPYKPSSHTLLEGSRSPGKRRTGSPIASELRKRRRDTSPGEDLRPFHEQVERGVGTASSERAQSLTENGSQPQDNPARNIALNPSLSTETLPALQSSDPGFSISASQGLPYQLAPRSQSSAPSSRVGFSLSASQTHLGDTRRQQSMPLLNSTSVEHGRPISRSKSSPDTLEVEDSAHHFYSRLLTPRTSLNELFL